jgi:flagellar biosynthetic protein FliQ
VIAAKNQNPSHFTLQKMEPETAIEASREAIKVCFMVGGPILAVCLVVGLLMGLAQAMSHIQDQALATVPKILAILAVVALALPWFADRMLEFSEDQFSRPFMQETAALATSPPSGSVQSLLVEPTENTDKSYYPRLDGSRLKTAPVVKQISFPQPIDDSPKAKPVESTNPFSLPSYRFSRRPNENIEG